MGRRVGITGSRVGAAGPGVVSTEGGGVGVPEAEEGVVLKPSAASVAAVACELLVGAPFAA